MRLRQICQRLRCGSEIPSQGFSGMPHTKFTRHIPYRTDHVVAGSRQTWWVVFWGVWVYIGNPRERGARPGVLVTVNAAACYSPTSSRVQYHRRARP